VHSHLAAFDGALEAYLKSIVGVDAWASCVSEMSTTYEVAGEDCVKSPVIASGMISSFLFQKFSFPFLEDAVAAVDDL
jgi:hypothetical protein